MKFDRLYKMIMEDVKSSKKHLIKEEMEPGYWEKVDQYKKDIQTYLDKGDGEEYDGFEGYVDEDDFYTTIEEIAAQNKDKISALENELLSYVESCPGGDSGDSMDGSLGLYQDIMEGNEGYAEYNIFYGLTDPETWTNLGFNVGEELAVLLKQHFVDCVDPDGSFWEGWGNDGADDSAQDTLNKIGLSKVVEAIEKIRSGEYDDQDQDDQDYDEQDDDYDVPEHDEKLTEDFSIKYIVWFSKLVQVAAKENETVFNVSLLDATTDAFKTAVAQGKITKASEVDKWIDQFVQQYASTASESVNKPVDTKKKVIKESRALKHHRRIKK